MNTLTATQSRLSRVLVSPFLKPARVLGWAFAFCLPAAAFAAFGVTASGTNNIVDTGAGLVFTVNAGGDIRSMLFNGQEMVIPDKPTSLNSGTGATSVNVTNTGNIIKLTCNGTDLTHYYVVRKGENNIYMATFTTNASTLGELRFLARFKYSVLPHGDPHSDNSGNDGNVEGKDVFHLPNGQTRSKFYSAIPFIDDHVHGATGTNIGAFMVIAETGYEKAAGGPFFKDIDAQSASGGDQEVYYYMNSGHARIEEPRQGLHGPYALCITNGSTPSASLDMSWMGSLGLTGWVQPSARGHVTGTVSGLPSGLPAVVAWSNSTAQYWAKVSGDTFTSPAMIPGTYTMTLYKKELAVATTSVTVTAGGSVTKNIASAEANPSTVWQIGTFDGTPEGFLNADLQTIMHPSDVRMAPWGPVTYTVGQPISKFPMAQFQLVNSPTKIVFNLTPAQVTSHKLRIGTTVSFGNGYPKITVNPGTSHEFVGPDQGPPPQPLGRSLTRGSYTGFYTVFAVDIPASAFNVGTNTIQIDVLGKGPFGGFLSASFGYDALALDGAGAASVAVTGVTVTPASTSVAAGGTTTLNAVVVPATATNKTVTWSSNNTSIATVNGSGLVTGVAAGTATITAKTQDGGFTANSVVTVTNINIPVTGLTVSPATVSVAVNGTTTLTAAVAPANATNKMVTWSSSAPSVAAVSASGVVTGVAAGSATITGKTQDGGFTATTVVTVTGSGTGGGGTCSSAQAVTLPFTKDGVADACFVTSGTVSFINSWNMQLIEINGVDFTNKWANSLPPPINGNYYIHYVGSFPWSHFEINGTP